MGSQKGLGDRWCGLCQLSSGREAASAADNKDITDGVEPFPVKICFISASLDSPPILSGVEVLITRVVPYLVQRGHQVSVITTIPQRSPLRVEEKDGVRVYQFHPLNIYERSTFRSRSLLARLIYHGIDLLWNPQSYALMKGILGREKPDVVHVHNWRGFSASLFSSIKSLGLPLVLTANDYFMVCPRATLLRSSGRICHSPPPVCRLYGAAKRLAVGGKVDLLTAPSQFVIDKLRGYGLFRDTRSVRLANPIALNDLHHAKKDHHTVNILYTGRLERSKGVHTLLDAFKQLKQENVTLHIAGDGDNAGNLRRMAGDDPRIVFHGLVPQEKLWPLYRSALIAVVPSIWYEPFGIVVIEGFKYGLAVVGSNIGGIPEIIQDGHNGVLFEPGNAHQLKGVLEKLIDDPAQLRKLGESAQESVRKYALNDYATEIERLYSEL